MLQRSFRIAAIRARRSIFIRGMTAVRTMQSSDQNTQMTGPELILVVRWHVTTHHHSETNSLATVEVAKSAARPIATAAV
jgi:hypothetical protein